MPARARASALAAVLYVPYARALGLRAGCLIQPTVSAARSVSVRAEGAVLNGGARVVASITRLLSER
jgi:hypothetical protein